MARRSKLLSENSFPEYAVGGTYDPALSADCRNGRKYGGLPVQPQIALSSAEFWGEDVLTPQGLCDGDQPTYQKRYRTLDEFEGVPWPVEYVEVDNEACDCEICFGRMLTEMYPPTLEDEDTEDVDISSVEREENTEVCEDNGPAEEVTAVNSFETMSVSEDSYSLMYEYLPKHTSSGVIREERDSRMEIRQGGRKHGRGTFSHGKRGNNHYKMLRRGRVRVTRRKNERIMHTL